MQEIGFVSWDEWKPILHQFNCPCCMGVRFMPDEEELEQRINNALDDKQKELTEARKAIAERNKEKGGDGD